MIVTQGSASTATAPQSTAASVTEASSQTAATAQSTPVAKSGPLLSGEAAAVVVAEQAKPAATNQTTAKADQAQAPAGLDLHGRDLRQVDLSKLDLRGANLADVDMTGKDLSGLNLSGAVLTNAKADGANFTDTNLHGVTATGARFIKATFDRTDMHNANFAGAAFNGASFARADNGMTQAELEKAHYGFIVRSSVFTNADFSGATFKFGGAFWDAKADGIKFDGANLGKEFGFIRGTLRNSSFQGISGTFTAGSADLSGADFTHIDGATVDIGQATIDNASFAGSHFKQLGLADLDLRTVNLNVKNKDLSHSYFADNIMSGMDFSGYNFSNSDFMSYGKRLRNARIAEKDADVSQSLFGTNFSGANFTGSFFSNVDFRESILTGAVFDDISISNWGAGDMLVHIDAATGRTVSALLKDPWSNKKAPWATGENVESALKKAPVDRQDPSSQHVSARPDTSEVPLQSVRSRKVDTQQALLNALLNAGAFNGVVATHYEKSHVHSGQLNGANIASLFKITSLRNENLRSVAAFTKGKHASLA